MRVILKRIDEEGREQRLSAFVMESKALVSELKDLISTKFSLESSFFHLETFLQGIKVLLTDTFPLSFFFSNSTAVIFLAYRGCLINLPSPKYSLPDLVQGPKVNLEEIPPYVIHLTDSNGWGLLHYSAVSGKDEAMQTLIDQNANVNQETSNHWTPLLLAAAHGQLACLAILLKHPCTLINKTTKRGSALHIAVEYNHIDVVSMLLKHKACCSLENPQGKIPLELANDSDIIELIPRYQGIWELEKYADKNKPLVYCGKVFRYSAFRLTDNCVFLYINLDLGRVEEYTSKYAFFTHEKWIWACNIHDIQHVGPVKTSFSLKSKFFFEIIGSANKLYYTKSENLRDEWVHQVCIAVNYCQVHRIGEKNEIFYKDNSEEEEENCLDPEENYDKMLELFERLEEIGAGSFGTVYKVRKRDTGQEFAMKCLSKLQLKRKHMLRYAISEIKIMQQLSHPFILKLHWAFENENALYLVLEYCSQGDLEVLIDRKLLTAELSRKYISEILLGLEYMHSLDVVYRDLKPANVLIGADGHVRLADFGLARTFEGENITSTLVGSPSYISPEVLCRENLTKASDIYTLGIVMHEMLSGKLPFTEFAIDKLFASIQNSKLQISNELSKVAQNIIKMTLKRNPKQRPGFAELKKHEFFQGVEWEKITEEVFAEENTGE